MSSAPAPGAAIAWEDVACPLCAARDEVPVLETPSDTAGRPLRLVRCGRCDLGYHNPRPDEPSIARFYPDDYGPYHTAEQRRRRPGWLARLRRLAAARWCGIPQPASGRGERLLARLAAPFLGPDPDSLTSLRYRGQGRLLDYGCGTGWLARRMRDLGWDVTGMDVSPYAAEQARRRFGLPVLVGTLPHPAVPAGSFDVIVMAQVLEHVHRPHAVVAAAARALRAGGYLAVVVPNLASWGFRTFRTAWWGLQLPIHLLHFTAPTLRRLLVSHGLEVRQESQPCHPSWVRQSMAAARRHGSRLPLWLRPLVRSRLAARLLARRAVAAGEGDCLLMIAQRPGADSAPQAA
jgi:2-polyprenyl-3-methyl-5-hydroxy-6-metoxy-1,4-benzoquinol methylase